jgi:toxin YoeB
MYEKIIFDKLAIKELAEWKSLNKQIYERIVKLIKDIQINPFDGIGKPEPLKYDKQGYWSRRINKEHRLVYKITENSIIIASCKFHY